MNISMADLVAQNRSLEIEINNAIQTQLTNGVFIGGEAVTNFEEEFARFIGVENCIGTGNGTDALEIAIESLDLPPGSEIIVPAMSFIATAEAVTRSGHIVRFADVDQFMNIDPEKLGSKINLKTKAIIVVHLYGQAANLTRVLEIANQKGLFIIEDCAQAAGTTFEGKNVGSFGDLAAFSFYPGKNLGAIGDAGAITTNSKTLAKKCRMIANHGRETKYDHEFEGRNSRLDSIQASVLSVKLKQLNTWIRRRQEIARKYHEAFHRNAHFIPLPVFSIENHTYHQFVGECNQRSRVVEVLKSAGITTSVVYPKAIPLLDAYKLQHGAACKDFHAAFMADRILSIPVHEMLTNAEVDYIIKQITELELK
ncbi:MAG: aminotransferase class V-fold PLP-dependent enzyme [Actinobacteria bacterium]|uniref:Unannotated protein n=1 Tax=freshwater metagenome TaxID=449393 RepID=A0A6J6E2X2_9ZZZZ|nr:aminotransferase class V-fold PLP-dependent enzyme [Actinomycetota bacterium]